MIVAKMVEPGDWMKKIKLKFKKIPRMNTLIFWRVIMIDALIFVGVLLIVFLMGYRFLISQHANNRIDLLRQLADNNASNQKIMMNVMGYIQQEIFMLEHRGSSEPAKPEAFKELFAHLRTQLDIYDRNMSAYLIRHDKHVYSTEGDKKSDWIESMMRSYWYIKHYSGEITVSWNLHRMETDNVDTYKLCYALTLVDQHNEPTGVLIVASTPDSLIRSYNKLIKKDNTIFIMDDRGIVISHTNRNMIGVWLFTVNSFKKQYDLDSYKVVRKTGENYLVTNYQDPHNGWIFVEEERMDSFYGQYKKIILVVVGVLLFGFGVLTVQNYASVRKISAPLIACAKHMSNVRDDTFEPIPIQRFYREILVLSTGYNSMLVRIQRLISKIKKDEEEKRRLEFAFLQSQINPHFFKNTLLAIKGLVVMEQNEKAAEMISTFMEMLHIPMKADIKGHKLQAELDYAEKYIALMGFRYSKNFQCKIDIEQALDELIVPPLILQPLIENAIFHGLSMLEDREPVLTISAHRMEGNIILAVEDNGVGMDQNIVYHLNDPSEFPKDLRSGGIGLRNVLARIKHAFGEKVCFEIKSSKDNGTTVKIIIQEGDDYQDLDR